MSEDGFKFQANYKTGPNSQDMVNVRGDSAEEFQHNVRALNGLSHDLFLAGETIRAGGMGNQPVGAPVGAPPNPVPPAVPQPAPGWTQPAPPQPTSQALTPHCAHGPMTHKSGIGKTGKPYSAHFCNGPENQRCAPVWS